MPILTMYDRGTKLVRANVVPQKGVEKHAQERLERHILPLGYKKIY